MASRTRIFTAADERAKVAAAIERVNCVDLKNKSIKDYAMSLKRADFGALVLPKDCIIDMPTEASAEDSLRIEKVGNREMLVIFCPFKDAAGGTGVKKIYASAFGRDVPVYDEATLLPVKEDNGEQKIVTSKADSATAANDVYSKVHDLTNDWNVFTTLAGKTLKVAQVKEATVPRYFDGNIVGTRTRKVPCFVIA